jgi:hypothetical protein
MESDSVGRCCGQTCAAGLPSPRPALWFRHRHPRPGRPYTSSGRAHRLGGISLVPRNSPCPCGSGKKYKHCCLDRERELVRRADAFEELFGLASMFPLLRPDSPEFNAWVDARREAEVTRESDRVPHDDFALLDQLERLSAQLPIAGRANASAVLAEGCAGFQRDGEVRLRLAALLLADALGPLQRAQALVAHAA